MELVILIVLDIRYGALIDGTIEFRLCNPPWDVLYFFPSKNLITGKILELLNGEAVR